MDTIDQIRDFNRFYTHQTGLVGRNYVSGKMGLSELRVLYELSQPDPPTARQLAHDLGLDEGYLSRILAKFTKTGWLERRADKSDRRVSRLNVTQAGQAKVKTLKGEARARIARSLSATDCIEQAELVAAMSTVRRILSAPSSGVNLRDLQPGDCGWLIQKHSELYTKDQGLNASFEAFVAEMLADFIRQRNTDCERAFIAERNGQRLGSIFCMRQSDEVAKLRLFLLVPQARGLGLGHMLLDSCVEYARERGYRRMVLWTEKNLTAACALYAKAGFEITSEKESREFGVDLVTQNWEIQL